jgi:hypothetical protein
VSQPPLVAEGSGKRVRFAMVDEALSVLAELKEGSAEVEPQIDGLLVCVAPVGEMLEGDQRLLKVRHRLPRGRAHNRLRTSLTAVGHGLLPHLTPERVVGEPFALLG